MTHVRSATAAVALIAFISLAWLALGFLVTSSYVQLMLTLVPIWAVMGLSWNILSGYTGLVSFGHASFFGLGAYTVTIALVRYDVTPWLGIPLGMIVGAVAGILIGYPTFRLRGHYFALAMLAYPLALLYVFSWLGYQEVALPMKREAPHWYMQFENFHAYTGLAVALLAAALLVSLAIERSRFGLSLVAIKQNEPAAEAAGIDTLAWKMKAIVLSGAIAAAAGGLYAVVLLVVTPESVFGMLTSAQALIVTLFGGVGTLWGPVIGAAILVPVSEVLQARLGDVLPGIQGVVFGAAIIVVILLAPEGIFWRVRDRLARRAEPTIVAPRAEVPLGQAAVMHADGAALLEVDRLAKSFGGVRAVADVSFTVREGEILGIIGPNGAGKTTLFNLLNGFLRPDDGTMRFGGHDLMGLKPNRACRLGIGRTFQVVRSFPRLSLFENVLVGAYVAAATPADAASAAQHALDRVRLSSRADEIAGALSMRDLRLMELARALAGRPRLILMDEPLAGLAAGAIDDMLAVIQSLAAGGLTIVIIEHTMSAMMRLAPRFLVLDHGALLAAGTPQEVTSNPAVIEAYLGKKWAARRA
ncbi:MAG TPA: branched-chain amino acid ABC transporter ATP-binding protein/permease [Stellaceae bacterium]|nr:branched-chain amino acid ABC transporter ATP-binding protein/permease [Stellaceae bacterium]